MLKVLKPTLAASIIAASFSFNALAADIEKMHFLIPGGAGGGWDMTARGTGDVLIKSDIVETVSFQNLSGGGGGKAIAHLIETADRQEDTLMVNSTPIVVRSLAQWDLSTIFPRLDSCCRNGCRLWRHCYISRFSLQLLGRCR